MGFKKVLEVLIRKGTDIQRQSFELSLDSPFNIGVLYEWIENKGELNENSILIFVRKND
jgi:hypothetical protein